MGEPIETIIHNAYAAFNARDINAVLVYFHPAVHWPNHWQGGYVEGHEGVRDYWTRQWVELDPHVTPVAITPLPDGRTRVDVRQTVKNLQGALLLDGVIQHVYTFEDGLIKDMEIHQG